MMRRYVFIAGMLLGLCLCGVAEAQTTSTLSATRPSTVGPSTFLRRRILLSNLFFNFGGLNNQRPIGQTVVPDPASKDFLKAFGFKRLGQ